MYNPLEGMKNISVKLPFDSTRDQTRDAYKKLQRQALRIYLGRSPTAEDEDHFKETVNADNSSVNDLFFEGKKIGSLATTYTLDMPRGINLNFTSHP
jgi:hypothetical protein